MSRNKRKGGGREVEVRIEAMGARGDGLAKLEDGTLLFVPHVLPGELVRVRTSAKSDAGQRGDVIELLEASPERRDPRCENSARCGGCIFQIWAPAAQASWKAAQVKAAVARAGFQGDLVQPLISPPNAGRRRARFVAKKGRLGFRERRNHEVIAAGPCMTLGPELHAFWQAIQGLNILDAGGEWTVTATPAGLDISVQSEANAPSPTKTQDVITQLGQIARLSWNEDMLLEIDAPRLNLGGLAPILPPGGFLQPSPGGQEALQKLVLDAIPKDADWVADLYCGLGTFAIPLAARGHRVQALESFEPAIAALDAAVRRDPTNTFKIHVGLRNLDLYPLRDGELSGFDALVFDPPRAGARSQAWRIAQSKVRTVVAVSCNPTTWARDAALLREGGYNLESVTPVDQFAHTSHLELVSVFRKARASGTKA